MTETLITPFDDGLSVTAGSPMTTMTLSSDSSLVQIRADGTKKSGCNLSPQLYFKYIKSKFSLIQRKRADAQLRKLEKDFEAAIKFEHEGLSEKLFEQCCVHAKEVLIHTKGIRYFITKEHYNKYKYILKDGHISDTPYEKYTRFIPKRAIKKKKELEGIFDKFIIFHYYNDKQKDVKKMSPQEKSDMKDPILFGKLDGVDKLYFIDDWEDEYCTLTFGELVDMMKLEDNEITVKRHPDFFTE